MSTKTSIIFEIKFICPPFWIFLVPSLLADKATRGDFQNESQALTALSVWTTNLLFGSKFKYFWSKVISKIKVVFNFAISVFPAIRQQTGKNFVPATSFTFIADIFNLIFERNKARTV